MERPEEVDKALSFLAENTSIKAWDKVLELLNYIHSLEMMIDTAYKTLEELDEVI